jgi:hypothetical protein
VASEGAISTMMKLFSQNFAGTVTKERCRLFHAALLEATDEQVMAATKRILAEHRGEFLPPVALVRDAIGLNDRGSAIDLEKTLRAISHLGETHPNSGRWRAPSTNRVEMVLGSAIAEAYGEAGGPLLFSDNQTTREIAEREFVRGLSRAVVRRGSDAIALPKSAPVAAQAGRITVPFLPGTMHP